VRIYVGDKLKYSDALVKAWCRADVSYLIGTLQRSGTVRERVRICRLPGRL